MAKSVTRRAWSRRPDARIPRLRGQRKLETGADIGLPPCPDAPAVASDDPLCEGETHSGALEVSRTVQSLEDAEQLVDILHVETGTVILDTEDDFVALGPALDANMRFLAFGAVLERVANEVGNGFCLYASMP